MQEFSPHMTEVKWSCLSTPRSQDSLYYIDKDCRHLFGFIYENPQALYFLLIFDLTVIVQYIDIHGFKMNKSTSKQSVSLPIHQRWLKLYPYLPSYNKFCVSANDISPLWFEGWFFFSHAFCVQKKKFFARKMRAKNFFFSTIKFFAR